MPYLEPGKVTYVWGSDKLGEDDEGRVLWETFFQHYFKVPRSYFGGRDIPDFHHGER